MQKTIIRISIKVHLCLCGVLASVGLTAAEASIPVPVEEDWAHIQEQARAFVQAESPDSVWPFAFEQNQGRAGEGKLVFAHFFSPFPLSFDNRETAEDMYTRVHLSPEGSDEKLNGRGGYKVGGGGALRERPLPAGPWESPYWRHINLAIEVLRAQRIGLDGFTYDMLSVTPGSRHREILTALLDVSARVAPGFKIVLMPDMNAELRRKPELLEDTIAELARHEALFRLDDGRLLISPYHAAMQPPEYWRSLLDGLEQRGVPSAFLPVFVGYGKLAENAAAYGALSYGLSDWGFRDIIFAEEFDFKNAVRHGRQYNPVWMMPVAPQDVRSKSLAAWESENTRAFRYLWDAAIKGDADMVQLITWNDYSESSEIAPSSATQFAFYDLTAYYTSWFKTGEPPAIREDAIYYTHRKQIFPFPEGVVAEKQREPFRQAGRTPFTNKVEMLAMLTAPATLEIEQNGKTWRFSAGAAGVHALDAPLEPGNPIMRIIRDGEVVTEVTSAWEVREGGVVENPVYHGGSSTRAFVPSPGGE